MEDDTLVETNEAVNSEQEVTENVKEPTKSTKKISARVAAGIGAGAAVVGAGAAAIPFIAFGREGGEPVNEDPQKEDPQQEEDVSEHVPVVSDLPVATSVTDDMSFSEAFAAAREEVGPGGIFYHHGHAYGTYYETEWNNMSADQKADYWASVNHTHAEYLHEHHNVIPHHDEIATQYTLDDIEDVNLALTLQVDANHNDKPDLLVDVDGDGVGDVLLLDVEMDEDGRILSAADAREGKYELNLDDEDDTEDPVLEDDNHIIIPDEEMADSGSQEIAYNPDYDYSANTDLDPNAFIDNNIDTVDLV